MQCNSFPDRHSGRTCPIRWSNWQRLSGGHLCIVRCQSHQFLRQWIVTVLRILWHDHKSGHQLDTAQITLIFWSQVMMRSGTCLVYSNVWVLSGKTTENFILHLHCPHLAWTLILEDCKKIYWIDLCSKLSTLQLGDAELWDAELTRLDRKHIQVPLAATVWSNYLQTL